MSAVETVVYTDGACSGNPGPGGWAWVVEDGRFGSGAESHTTNQRMEIQAVLEALKVLTGEVRVVSDSTYVVKCFNDRWYEGWLNRGWKNSQKKPVANQDLWEPLIDLYLARKDELSFDWVKGHSGDEMNDKADELAVLAKDELMEREGLLPAKATKSEAKKRVVSLDGDFAEVAESDDVPWPIGPALLVAGSTDPSAKQVEALGEAIAGLDPDSAIVVSGLRRGAELLAAEEAVRRQITLAAVLPFPDPAASWPEDDRQRFDLAFGHAVYDVTLEGNPATPGTALKGRNVWYEHAALGAIVVGDDSLAKQLEAAGLTVVRL